MRELQRDQLRVVVSPDRATMGAAAAADVAARLRDLLADPSARARVVFAAAASQVEVLDALVAADGIDWSRVEAFQLDEYVGPRVGDPRSLNAWLEDHILGRVPLGRIERLDGGNPDPEAESARFGALLADGGLDLALIGIGENGHLAYNDPHVADFNDPQVVKVVEIDETSRRQAVHDGAFPSIDEVPRLAITVTMSTILASRALRVAVPGPQKAVAVARTLDGQIETACPASALRLHPDAVLYVDEGAASNIRV